MTPENKHPEEDPLNPFNRKMWEDQDRPHERTEADAMFGELLKAQDELEKDDPNLIGLARHQSGPEDSAPVSEPSKADLPSIEVHKENVIKRYFLKFFKKQG